MNILLINPPNCGRSIPEERYGITSIKQIFRGEPLALETLAGNLPEHEVRIVDLKARPDGLDEALRRFTPDLIGFTAVTCEANWVRSQAPRLQAECGATLVAGGIHASNDPEFFNAPGIDYVVLGLGKQSLRELIASLKDVSKMAEDHGVTVCVKAHVGAAMYNTPTTLRVLEAVDSPAFGLDMDPSHIHRAGENPVDALRQVVSRIRHVHIRDCKGRGPSPGEPMNQACGRGDIDLFGYFNVLVAGGYDGPVCLEVIGAGECSLNERIVIAAETYGFLNAIFKSMGAR